MSGLKNDSTRTPAILGMTRDKDVAFHKSHDRGKRIPGWRSGSSQLEATESRIALGVRPLKSNRRRRLIRRNILPEPSHSDASNNSLHENDAADGNVNMTTNTNNNLDEAEIVGISSTIHPKLTLKIYFSKCLTRRHVKDNKGGLRADI